MEEVTTREQHELQIGNEDQDSKNDRHSYHESLRYKLLSILFTILPERAREDMDSQEVFPYYLPSYNYFARFWMTYAFPLAATSNLRPLQFSDLYKNSPNWNPQELAQDFLKDYQERCRRALNFNERLKSGQYRPSRARKLFWKLRYKFTGIGSPDGFQTGSLALSVYRILGNQFWYTLILALNFWVSGSIIPILLKYFINYLTDAYNASNGTGSMPSVENGIGLCTAIIFVLAIGMFSFPHCMRICRGDLSMKIFATLEAAIYLQGITFTPESSAEYPVSYLMTNLGVDITRVADFVMTACEALIIPILVFMAVPFLIHNLGWAGIIGLLVLLIMIPFTRHCTKKIYRLTGQAMKLTDSRINLVNELLHNFKVMKMFGWETPYIQEVDRIRTLQLKCTRMIEVLLSFQYSVASGLPLIASVIAIVFHWLISKQLDTATVFSSISMFTVIGVIISFSTESVTDFTRGRNSLERLSKTFSTATRSNVVQEKQLESSSQDAVILDNCSFRWQEVSEPYKPTFDRNVAGRSGKRYNGHFDNLNLRVAKGSLVAICGPIGCGKSSLLSSLVGETSRTNGSMQFSGSLAYVSQTPWLESTTVRDNILFGLPYNDYRYWQAVRSCCLHEDLIEFPDGDATAIGERGLTLRRVSLLILTISEVEARELALGCKAVPLRAVQNRDISLNRARALYANADIYLLDDILMAVDSRVGRAIFDKAIKGFLNTKTVIFATHALQHVSEFSRVICLKAGEIIEDGTFDELVSRESYLSNLIETYITSRKDSVIESTSNEFESTETFKNEAPCSPGALMQAEERTFGSVSFSAYLYLLKNAGGLSWWILLFTIVLIGQGSALMSNALLSFWISRSFAWTTGTYMGLYVVLGLVASVGYSASIVTVTFMSFRASKNLHRTLTERIFRASMTFIDSTPLGRIITRFSQDVNSLDAEIPTAARQVIYYGASTIGIMILIAILLPAFFIVSFALLLIMILLYKFYGGASRDLRKISEILILIPLYGPKRNRIDNLLRSNVHSHAHETFNGRATIRAFNRTEFVLNKNSTLIDYQMRAQNQCTYVLFSYRIYICFFALIPPIVVIIILFLKRKTLNPVRSGLLLNYLYVLTTHFMFFARELAFLDREMNSIERVIYYSTKVEQEDFSEKSLRLINDTVRGEIKFNNVSMRYREGLPLALKNVSFTIRPGQTVGVIGRTGSGKTSLLMCLLRLVEIAEGTIEIDGTNLQDLSLVNLRSIISVIPQEGLIFSGTLRTNLDPFNEYDDAILNSALRASHLLNSATSTNTHENFSLDTKISDQGTNLSLGQKSLISLARAIVKNSHILCLDEVTASADLMTDERIQLSIKKEFKDRTCLAIAHRIQTIIGYDRILIMDSGTVAEFGDPIGLFESKGIFNELCKEARTSLDQIRKAQSSKF